MKKTPMSVIFRLICVRHGETEANREMRIQGHMDIPLSKVGEEQSKQAGKYLSTVHFTRAYTSDLMRAKQTCFNIIQENDMPSEYVKMDVRIRERNFGCVEGLLFKEVLEMAAAAGSSWPKYNPPGAEELPHVQQRFVEFFKEMCQSVYDSSMRDNKIITTDSDIDLQDMDPAEKVLMVSHGAGLKQLFTHFKKTLECEDFPPAVEILTKIPPNTSISEFIVKYSPRKYQLKCVRFYDAKHLENLG